MDDEDCTWRGLQGFEDMVKGAGLAHVMHDFHHLAEIILQRKARH